MNWKIFALFALTAGMHITVHASDNVNTPENRQFLKQQENLSRQLREKPDHQLKAWAEKQVLENPLQRSDNHFLDELVRKQQASQDGKPRQGALYFVSFSIPEEGLKRMLGETRHYGIPATLRGMVNNDLKTTAEAVLSLVKDGATDGVQIDPTLFSQYGIRSVPTLVVFCSQGYDIIRIGDLPIIRDSEIQNFCLHGTVGAGKSEVIRRLANYARQRGDMVVIYDRSGEFVKSYYDPSIDKILNPLDARCAAWDLWKECLTQPDFDNTANTLIPMGTKEDPFWQGSGRTIFAEAAYLMRNDPNRSYSKLVDTLLSIKIEKLRTFLRNSPAANLVEEKIEKTAISIRAVLTNYVKAIRYLQGIEHNGEPFTIRDWMRGVREDQKNGWLFISSNADTHASLKPVISMWLSIAIRGLLAMGENRNRRVWFFCDELSGMFCSLALRMPSQKQDSQRLLLIIEDSVRVMENEGVWFLQCRPKILFQLSIGQKSRNVLIISVLGYGEHRWEGGMSSVQLRRTNA